MTPNEKAAQLVVDNQMKVRSLGYVAAVQCAIVTADEMINEFTAMNEMIGELIIDTYAITNYIAYWQSVKEILQRLC